MMTLAILLFGIWKPCLFLDPDTLLATISFKVKARDCAIIVNSCNSVISVSGTINGTGAISG
jgi:hypothetical protein